MEKESKTAVIKTKTDNLKFWDSVEKTDPAFTKKVTYGNRSFTTIDAYYQIKTATEKFGPFGASWGVKNETLTFHDDLLIYQAEFFYPYEGKTCGFPIASAFLWITTKKDLTIKKDDDCVKSVRTDALTKGLSFLGFNSDVFLGKFDNNKYVEELKKQKSEESKSEPAILFERWKEVGNQAEEFEPFCTQVLGKQKPSSTWTDPDLKAIREAMALTPSR